MSVPPRYLAEISHADYRFRARMLADNPLGLHSMLDEIDGGAYDAAIDGDICLDGYASVRLLIALARLVADGELVPASRSNAVHSAAS
jgi:hypothetical protein